MGRLNKFIRSHKENKENPSYDSYASTRIQIFCLTDLIEHPSASGRRRVHLLALNIVLPQVDFAEESQLGAIIFSRSTNIYASRCRHIASCCPSVGPIVWLHVSGTQVFKERIALSRAFDCFKLCNIIRKLGRVLCEVQWHLYVTSMVLFLWLLFLNLFTVPYPFLTENPFSIRVGIYVGASAIALGSFWSLNALHSN